MIRVLHFAGVINRHDFIDTVLTRLDRSRFEVTALTCVPAQRTDPDGPDANYETRCLNLPLTWSNAPAIWRALVAEIKRTRPDAVQAHHFRESLLAAIAVRMLGVSSLLVGHHYSDHIYFLSTGLRRRAHLLVEAFTNRTASRIVVPAEDVARILTERQGVPGRRVSVIPYALEFDRYRASTPDAARRLRAEWALEDHPLVLTCCRMNREKGLEYLLRAMPQVRSVHPSVRLVMIGDGPLKADLLQLSRDLGVADVVQFPGWRTDALDWFDAADIVVQPSLCESYCQVLVEALAFRKPVVMTPVGVGPEVIGENERGRLVPRADSPQMAVALIELLGDRQLGRTLGEKGYQYVHQHMAIDRIVRQHEQLYLDVIAEAAPTSGAERSRAAAS